MTSGDVHDLVTGRLNQARIALEDAKYLMNGDRSMQSVVNRAYYAMFYAALALLQKVGTLPSKHSGVISLFDTQFVLKGVFPKKLSQDFHKAFELRQLSDYRAVEPCSLERAAQTLENAVAFVDAVVAYLEPSTNIN